MSHQNFECHYTKRPVYPWVSLGKNRLKEQVGDMHSKDEVAASHVN